MDNTTDIIDRYVALPLDSKALPIGRWLVNNRSEHTTQCWPTIAMAQCTKEYQPVGEAKARPNRPKQPSWHILDKNQRQVLKGILYREPWDFATAGTNLVVCDGVRRKAHCPAC